MDQKIILDASSKKLNNRKNFVNRARENNFNVFLPLLKSKIDFILLYESNGDLRKVKLKTRWIIDRNYLNRDIWIAFPNENEWYLILHDDMVAVAAKQGFTNTESWIGETGTYHLPYISSAVLKSCQPFRF